MYIHIGAFATRIGQPNGDTWGCWGGCPSSAGLLVELLTNFDQTI